MEPGIYPIWKKSGPSSHDVVNQIRQLSSIKKVGHAGTLDPLAEGVLVVAVGREFTKQIDRVKEQEKEYVAQIRLGQTSVTDDDEGEKQEHSVDHIPSKHEVQMVLNEFIGQIRQTAPKYSAVKIYGKEAYKRAREGEEFPLPPRDVEIKKIELLAYQWPCLEIKLISGPGVYVRSLARDIGLKLDCGGYLAKLVRTRVGKYSKSNSYSVKNLSSRKDS